MRRSHMEISLTVVLVLIILHNLYTAIYLSFKSRAMETRNVFANELFCWEAAI